MNDAASDLRRLYIVAVLVEGLITAVVLAVGAALFLHLSGQQAAQDRFASCQFAYAAQLSGTLQVRAALADQLRVGHASPAEVNAALARHPIPGVPRCQRS